MSNNGTDRDIALQIVSELDNCATLIETFNHNMYGPVIYTQPTDQEVAIGENAVFTLSAGRVDSYRWQYKATASATSWTDSTLTGAYTDTLTVQATEARYAYVYRCKITGTDGTVIYSDEVQMTAPEVNG